MKVRLLKRSTVIRNILVFLIFSLFYLQVVYSLYQGASAFELLPFLENLKSRPWVIGCFIPAFLTVYFGTRLSSFFFALFCTLVLGESVIYFLESFDKLILILIFFYAVCSVNFLLFWKLEREEAVYRPSFDKNFIGKFNEYDLPVELESPLGTVKAMLTNWDENGCFLVLEDFAKSLRGKISFKVFFEGLEFSCEGRVATKYANGYGILIDTRHDKPLNWKSFYDIVSDRGYKPRY